MLLLHAVPLFSLLAIEIRSDTFQQANLFPISNYGQKYLSRFSAETHRLTAFISY